LHLRQGLFKQRLRRLHIELLPPRARLLIRRNQHALPAAHGHVLIAAKLRAGCMALCFKTLIASLTPISDTPESFEFADRNPL
jgi:hypothetical protein